jgi:hypothetical protein
MSAKISTKQQVEELTRVIYQYLRLPLSDETIPGSFLEGVLAHVRGGTRLNTYDFVDVISRKEKIGWQVKSTKSSTPVTWKRAKIPNSLELIEHSKNSSKGLQNLGDAIINFCNEHAEQSIKDYGLDEIYYSRLVVFDTGEIKYVERKLCDKKDPRIFIKEDYEWHWSTPKKTVKKEQLPALHGYNKRTNEKEWAWHGLGENQLHFSGEGRWWTDKDSLVVNFNYPQNKEKLSLEELIKMLIAI